MGPKSILYSLIILLSIGGFSVSEGLAQGTQPTEACVIPPGVAQSRPDPEGPPTQVSVGVMIFDVMKIDEADQRFAADLFVALRWKDPRLSEAVLGYSLEGCRFKQDVLWHPEFLYINKRKIDRGFHDFGRVDKEGNVQVFERITGTFTHKFKLADFPFDTQTLPIKVGFARYSPDKVKFTPHEDTSGFFDEITIAGWDVNQGPISVKEIFVQDTADERSILTSHLIAKREGGYYIWKVFVPLCLIVFMSWMVFWINPKEHFGPRIGLSTATVFTLLAFMISLGHLLPAVSYLTRLDKCLLSATIMVFAALGVAVMTSRMAHKGHLKLARRIGKFFRFAYLPVFIFLFYYTLYM